MSRPFLGRVLQQPLIEPKESQGFMARLRSHTYPGNPRGDGPLVVSEQPISGCRGFSQSVAGRISVPI